MGLSGKHSAVSASETHGSRSNNEGKCCDAVLRLLEQRAGEARADLSRPRVRSDGPPVEYRFRLGEQRYAIEHTQIEPYENQILADQQFMQLVGPVKEALSGTLPGDAVYELVPPLMTGLGAKSATLRDAHRALIEWVRAAAARLHAKDGGGVAPARRAGRIPDSITGTPPGFPYEVTLYRRRLAHPTRRRPGSLAVWRFAPSDLRAARQERLRRALEKKCPKLLRCKVDGVRTILVLENNDLALSSSSDIFEALAPALDARGDAPDEVYLVETETDTWYVYLFAFNGEYCPVGAIETLVLPEDDLIDLSGLAHAGGGTPQRAQQGSDGVMCE